MSFARSLFTVSSLTVLSRVGGFARDFLTAVFLGAGPIADAFFVAQRLPNLFRSLFAEGAFSAAFVPIYAAEHERNGKEAAQRFAGQALMLLLAALIPFSVLVMLFMPQVMLVLAPGFQNDPGKYEMAVQFSTITFPYLALISVTALQTGVLNALGKFAPGAAAPIALNIVMILGLLASQLFDWHVGYTLAWSVTIAGGVQCAWLAISCYRAKASIPLPRPHWDRTSRELFRRIGPGAIGAGAAQINLLISTVLASTLATGALSHLFYADRLTQLPLGIVGIAVATTLLPLLSRHIEAGDEAKVRHYNSRAIEFCFLLGLPATIGLILVGQPIIETLFQYGAFKHEDTVATAEALRAYALGIPAFLLIKVFSSGFFARKDTSTPVKAGLMSLLTNVVCAVLLLETLQHVGIALAHSIAVTMNASVLYLILRRKKMPLGEPGLGKRLVKLVASAAIMAATAFALLEFGWKAFSPSSAVQKVAGLSALIGLSGLSYLVALHLTGAFKLRNLKGLIGKEPSVH